MPSTLSRMHVVILTALLVVSLGAFSRASNKIDLDALMMTRADMPGLDVQQVIDVEPGSRCYPDPIKGRTLAATRGNGRPFFGQSLLLYRSPDAASNVFVGLKERWAECTWVTWRMPVESLNGPTLGDESASFFISVDCCSPVNEHTIENGHLHTLFVRRGRLIEILMVITRDTSLYETVVTGVDAEVARRLGR